MELSDHLNSPRDQYPPVVRIAVMSELILIAAVLVQHNEINPAKAIINRVQKLTQGENVLIYAPEVFKANLDKLLKAIARR